MAAAIDPKKSITIINAFVVSTVQFLNQFAVKANDKLDKLNRQIQRLEALTQLLEYKLADIPAISEPPKSVSEASKSAASSVDPSSKPPSQPDSQPAQNPSEESASAQPPQPPQPEIPDEAKTYVRMLGFGIPRDAVKQKMRSEGHDPSLLDVWMPVQAEESG